MDSFTSSPAAHFRPGRRRAAAGAVVALGLLTAMPGIAGNALAAGTAAGEKGCPAAEQLVKGTTFHHRTVAAGVTLTHGVANDANGTVDIRELKVTLTRPSISVQPLVKSLAHRSPLTTLAKGHAHLVAATNTGYFDFETGAPLLPFIGAGAPKVLSTTHAPAFGFNAHGLAQFGDVWLSGSLTAGDKTVALAAVNELDRPAGLTLYTSAWGSAHIGNDNTESRVVTSGSLGAVQDGEASVPSGGDLLVSRGPNGRSALESLTSATKVSIKTSVRTDAAAPFVQAYGVGPTLVATSGAATTGHTCHSANTQQPARTAIGWTDGGRTLVIVTVADHPYTSQHGLDEDQLASLMVQLGVSQAFTLDGSGSTELLAMNSDGSITAQGYLADGEERPMPLGLAIIDNPVKPSKHKTVKHPKKTAKKHPKKTTKKKKKQT
jgi:Phosphodiester glycosidase